MKLSQLVAAKAMTELIIASIQKEVTESGEPYVILNLATPLEKVVGSQSISNIEGGITERVTAWDVESVKVGPAVLDDDGFDLDENGKGTYKGDLRLDVTKKTFEVWLTDVSFLSFGRAKRNENQTKANSGLIAKIEEARKARLAKTSVGGAAGAGADAAGAAGGENLLGIKDEKAAGAVAGSVTE